MARTDSRILSRPCEVAFEGFVSNTTVLQQAGWEISAEQLIDRNSVRLALRHQGVGLRGVTDAVEYDFFRDSGFERAIERPLRFQVAYMAPRIDVVAPRIMADLSRFRPIDAMPTYTVEPIRSIDDLGIFATPLARTEELIVEPETVMGLLERIKAMQSPEQAAIRARNRRREAAGKPIARQVFHAQILSLAA